MLELPRSDNGMLSALLAAVRADERRLEREFRAVACHKSVDQTAAGAVERIALELTRWRRFYFLTRLHAWSTRWVWFDIRRADNDGWPWSWTVEGYLRRDLTGRQLYEAAQKTVALMPDSAEPVDEAGLLEVWNAVLTSTPPARFG